MTHRSDPELLVLHAIRLIGYADSEAAAARFGLDASRAREDLLDAQARGWVTWSVFADLAAWSLTGAGRRRNEAALRDELDGIGARPDVTAVHEEFGPLNAEATRVFTEWQLGSRVGVPAGLGDGLGGLERRLTARLARFAGYHDRFGRALDRAGTDTRWITGIDVDSCHRVWFEFHEDLIATLGLSRG